MHAVGGEGSILVYGNFEKTRLTALRSSCPDIEAELNALVNRLVDLCGIVTNNVYHPQFRGSFSIKAVLPALVPDLSYAGLAVADGDKAITRFARIARGEIAGVAVAETRDQLLEYCKLDTLGMVRLHEVTSDMVK